MFSLWGGPAGSGSRAWPWGCDFEPNIGHRVSLIGRGRGRREKEEGEGEGEREGEGGAQEEKEEKKKKNSHYKTNKSQTVVIEPGKLSWAGSAHRHREMETITSLLFQYFLPPLLTPSPHLYTC